MAASELASAGLNVRPGREATIIVIATEPNLGRRNIAKIRNLAGDNRHRSTDKRAPAMIADRRGKLNVEEHGRTCGGRYWNEALAEQGDKAALLRKHYEPHIRELVEHFERTLPRDNWDVANAVIAMAGLPFGSRPGRLVVGSDAPDLKAVNAAHAVLQQNMIGRSTIPGVIKPI